LLSRLGGTGDLWTGSRGTRCAHVVSRSLITISRELLFTCYWGVGEGHRFVYLHTSMQYNCSHTSTKLICARSFSCRSRQLTCGSPSASEEKLRGKKWSLIEVFSLRGLRNGPGYTINNYVQFNQTTTYHVNECLAILAESGSETTSEVLKIQNFPGWGGMPPDPPSRCVLCTHTLY